MIQQYTHKQLILIAYRWVLKNASCGCAFKELVSVSGEIADVIGFGSWGHSVLIEVKVSRSDFLADKKKPFRIIPEKGMGKFRYYMCTKGLIKIDDLPIGWGLIYVDEKGKALCVYNPYKRNIDKETNLVINGHKGFDQNLKSEHSLMYSALRRLHIKGHIETIYDKKYNYNHKEA